MNKKIFIIAAIILVLTVALTACKSKEYDKKESTTENTDKVIQTVTVTGENGGVTTVEIYEDASGDKYITNVQGNKVPLTTDSQGFSDDIGYLVTSTAPAAQQGTTSSTAPSNTVEPTAGSENSASNTQDSSSEPESSSSAENSTGGGIIIGSQVPQDSISWDDIKNPKK